MTNEEIRIKIARAKGWMNIYKNPGNEWRVKFELSDFADFIPDLLGDDPADRNNDVVPNWPENIADAWELYHEMKMDGCIVVVTHAPDGHGYCNVNPQKSGARIISTYAADEIGAICLAWLAWDAARKAEK